MSRYSESLNQLKKVLIDPYCSKHMNCSTIKGFYGELLLAEKLEQEGLSVTHKGNQCGYDLEYRNGNKTIKIDVKSSTLKNEIKKNKDFFSWGWALKHTNKTRPVSCTHFACIALDENYNVCKYLIINAKDLDKFPRYENTQFKNVERGLVLMQDTKNYPSDMNQALKEYFKTCKKIITNKKLVIVKNKNDKILESIV